MTALVGRKRTFRVEIVRLKWANLNLADVIAETEQDLDEDGIAALHTAATKVRVTDIMLADDWQGATVDALVNGVAYRAEATVSAYPDRGVDIEWSITEQGEVPGGSWVEAHRVELGEGATLADYSPVIAAIARRMA